MEIKCPCQFKGTSLEGVVCPICPASNQPKPAPGKDATNCQKCIDCQRMTDGHATSWRCYGSDSVGELKRDICVAEQPPINAPDFCPNRKREKPAPVKSAAVPVLLGETVMTDAELQKFAIGCVDYPKDANGVSYWNHPKFTKGMIQRVMRQIAKEADAHTRGKISKALKEISYIAEGADSVERVIIERVNFARLIARLEEGK